MDNNEVHTEVHNEVHNVVREIARMRLGRTGDASRPLGWKKIANKLKTSIDEVRTIRRSNEYYDCINGICTSIGIARLQARAARKGRGVAEWLENAFGFDMYSARMLAESLDVNPLPLRPVKSNRNPNADMISDERIEELAIEADNLVVASNCDELVSTIALSRKHVHWLLKQGYAEGDRLLLRAASMTRGVCSRHTPEWSKKDKTC